VGVSSGLGSTPVNEFAPGAELFPAFPVLSSGPVGRMEQRP
jgi:hypothetical protein